MSPWPPSGEIKPKAATIADATCTLMLDDAVTLGLAQANTAIGFYVGGLKVGGYAGTSPNTALNWQSLSVQFSSNGLPRTVRIVLEGGNASRMKVRCASCCRR